MPSGTERTTEFGLADFARTLRRRVWAIVITMVVVTGLVLAYSLHKPSLYRSEAGLLLQPAFVASASGVTQQSQGSIDIPTQIALVNSDLVQGCVRDETVHDPTAGTIGPLHVAPAVVAAQQGQTNIIDISATTPHAVYSAQVADKYATCYTKERQRSNSKAALAAEQQLQAQLASTKDQITAQTESVLALESSGKASAQQISQAQQKLDTLTQQQTTYQQQLQETQLIQSLNTGGAQLVNEAKPHFTPVSPQPVRDGLIAALAGLILGIGIAFLLEFIDDRIRTKDDLERAVPDLPVVGVIPELPDWKNRKEPILVSLDRPRSPHAEAYRSLRTAVQFMGVDGPVKLLQVTSAAANDGKTATTANLATAMSMAGQKVAAVSCDLRRPRLHEFFGLENEVGLTSVLLGEATLAEALVTEPTQGRLQVLPSGPIPPNPSELLAGQAITRIFEELAEHVDIVLIDSAPLLPVTDAVVLAGRMDAVLMVVTAGQSTERAVQRSLELLARVNAPVAGLVLNGASSEDTYGYRSGYGYRYGYGYRTGYGYASRETAEGERNGRQNGDSNGAGTSTKAGPEHAGGSTAD